MKRLLFLLLTFVSISVGAQEQIALGTTQHTRPRWVLSGPGNSSNNGCCASFVLPLNDLGAGAVNTTPAFSLGSGTQTFTRATTADTTLSTLCWASVASGTARSYYLPSGVYGGYIAEGARTNLLLQSSSLSTTWTNTSAAPTANAIGADCASNTGWTLTDSSAIAAANISQAVTLTAAAYTYHVFVQKTTSATTFPVMQAITGTVTALATINTNTCVPTAWTAYTGDTMLAGISVYGVQVGNYCWEWLTYTGTAASYTHYLYPAATATANQSTGIVDVTQQGSTVFWNPQVELGATASTPIPTTTLATQRNQDVLTFAGPQNISVSKGTAYAEVVPSVVSITGSYGILGLGLTGRIAYISGSADAAIEYDGTNSNISSVSLTKNTLFKVASSWGGSSMSIFVNGTANTSAFAGTMGVVTTLYIADIAGAAPLLGTIKNVTIWPVALSTPYLQTKTSDAVDFLGSPFWRMAANDDFYRKAANQ